MNRTKQWRLYGTSTDPISEDSETTIQRDQRIVEDSLYQIAYSLMTGIDSMRIRRELVEILALRAVALALRNITYRYRCDYPITR